MGKKVSSAWKGLLAGVLAAMGLYLLCQMLLAALVVRGVLPEERGLCLPGGGLCAERISGRLSGGPHAGAAACERRSGRGGDFLPDADGGGPHRLPFHRLDRQGRGAASIGGAGRCGGGSRVLPEPREPDGTPAPPSPPENSFVRFDENAAAKDFSLAIGRDGAGGRGPKGEAPGGQRCGAMALTPTPHLDIRRKGGGGPPLPPLQSLHNTIYIIF